MYRRTVRWLTASNLEPTGTRYNRAFVVMSTCRRVGLMVGGVGLMVGGVGLMVGGVGLMVGGVG